MAGKKEFLFSVIMPVYNSEKYVSDAIESVINQSIGFERNVFLIIVDDGSQDNSYEICKGYADKYRNNIKLVRKENGGVSTARNEGLKYVTGEYVAFPDSDDILSPDMFEKALRFFDEEGDDADIVSFPIKMFGDINGEHILNDKYASGTRIIDLLKEPENVQLHLASCVINAKVAKNIKFDEELSVAEDAKVILSLLIDNPKLGVISEPYYNYRRHSTSLLSDGKNKKEWYNTSVEKFSLETIKKTIEKYSYVPLFVQRAIAYEIQWKMRISDTPNCLDSDEAEQFSKSLKKVLSYIDDEIICDQKNVSKIRKAYFINEKSKENPIRRTKNDIFYGNNSSLCISQMPFVLEFLTVNENSVTIEARMNILRIHRGKISAFVKSNDERIIPIKTEFLPSDNFLNEPISDFYSFVFEIEKDKIAKETPTRVDFYIKSGALEIKCDNVVTGKFFPVSKKYENAYCYMQPYLFTFDDSSFRISETKKKTVKKIERRFSKELWASDKTGERKAVIARKLAKVYRFFHRKKIWLISDRISVASDSGEALFVYLSKHAPKGVKPFFAIKKGADSDRLKKYGKVVDRSGSFYKILHLVCDNIVSSQADDFVYNPFDYYYEPYRDILNTKKFVFLQHGVIKDDMSSWLSRYNKNIKGFVCSAEKEYQSIIKQRKYSYTENELWLTGLARFDRLYTDRNANYITVMPTWRKYLMTGVNVSNGKWKEREGFEKSDFFEFYDKLLNDERILKCAKENGYRVRFLPHPNLVNAISEFHKNSEVEFVTEDFSYRDIYATSALCVTDYSSAVFDFAYLNKPIIYTQFDKEKFFSGDHAYEKGYFDYEKNGFGKVTYDYEGAVSAILSAISNRCKNETVYQRRANAFFAYKDADACARITEKIMILDNGVTK